MLAENILFVAMKKGNKNSSLHYYQKKWNNKGKTIVIRIPEDYKNEVIKYVEQLDSLCNRNDDDSTDSLL